MRIQVSGQVLFSKFINTHTQKRQLSGSCKTTMFKLLKKFHTLFLVTSPIYTPTRNEQSSDLYTPFLILFIIFIIVILVRLKWHFIVLLICISLKINNVKYLFMFLQFICIYLVTNQVSVHF